MDQTISLSRIGVTKRQETNFAKKGITNILQLLMFFPLKYIDNTVETGAKGIPEGGHAVIIGNLLSCTKMRAQKGIDYVLCEIRDRKSGNVIRCMFFRQKWLADKYRPYVKKEVIVSGTVSYGRDGSVTIMSPEVLTTDIQGSMGILPVYRRIKGIPDPSLRNFIGSAFTIAESTDMSLVDAEAAKKGFVRQNEALFMLHFPRTMQDVKNAKKRLLYNDLFYMAARFTVNARNNKTDGIRVDDTAFCDEMIASLPYTLTADQASVFGEIRNDMINGRHFKALVQGDVSCGKTDVAFLSAYMAVSGGYQAAILAPTQILAEQHYEKLKKRLEGKNVEVVLIAGKYKKTESKKLSDGTAKVAVGTHALLSDKIQFQNLGLIIIDEEHRFGVKQRSIMENKAADIDCISMTATPIPRSLAKAVLGDDVKVYSIKTMPGGRKPVKTCCDNGNRVIAYAKHILSLGQQVYAVCPMIDEADENNQTMADVMNVHKAADIYRKHLGNGVKVGELTGEQTEDETNGILEAFRKNEINVLVSTTVVEVGVDVPNATLMIIHNAERFGLASMHQLRGRVGRGSEQSYCVLVSRDSPEENGRLRTLCETTDGFRISEEDLVSLRHSGNLFGTEQSGNNVYVNEVMRYDTQYKKIHDGIANVPTSDLLKVTAYLEAADLPKIHKMYEIDCTPC